MQQRLLVVVCLVLAVAVSRTEGSSLTPKGASPFAQITQESQIQTCGDLLAYTVKTKEPACVQDGFAIAPSVVKVACTSMADCQKWCCSAVGLKVEAALVNFARQKASKAALSKEVLNYRLYCVNSKKKNPHVDCSKKPAGIDAILEAAKTRPVMETKDAWANFEQREEHEAVKGSPTKKGVAFVQLAERQGLRNPVYEDKTWPAKTISYAIQDDVSEATVEEIVAAIKMLVDNTVLKFDKVDKDANGHKIVFTENTNYKANSPLGCKYPSRPTATKVAKDSIADAENTRQDITFDPRGWTSKNGATLAHELLHALGFHHMHQRVDRDTYLDLANVKSGSDGTFSCDVNINNKAQLVVYGKYDYKSIMHYLGYNPTKNCQADKTVDYRIKPRAKPDPDWPAAPSTNPFKIPGGAPIGSPSSGSDIGGATTLSVGDAESVDAVYGSKPEF